MLEKLKQALISGMFEVSHPVDGKPIMVIDVDDIDVGNLFKTKDGRPNKVYSYDKLDCVASASEFIMRIDELNICVRLTKEDIVDIFANMEDGRL